jgi:hypothetical protein
MDAWNELICTERIWASLSASSSLEHVWLRTFPFRLRYIFQNFSFLLLIEERAIWLARWCLNIYRNITLRKDWQFIEKQALLASEERLRSIELVGYYSLSHHCEIYRCVYEMHPSQLSLEVRHSSFTEVHNFIGIYDIKSYAQLVQALRYKPQVCGFDFQWCRLNFSLT